MDILKELNKKAHKIFSGNLLTKYAAYDIKLDQALILEPFKTEQHSNDDQKLVVILRGGIAGQMAESPELFGYIAFSMLYEALKHFKRTNELTDVEIKATIEGKKNQYFEYNKNRDTYNLTFRLKGLTGDTVFELP